jgi:Tol biopolymer transport system component
MRWWLTTLTLTIAIAVSGIQASAQPLTVWWLSFVANGNAQVPIRINPATGLVDSVNGVFVDSRFPSLSADGRQVVFQVGNGLNAQIWLAATQDNDGDGKVDEDPINNIDDDKDGRVDEDPVDWRTFQLTDPQSNQPLFGIHPVISADGNHIAFASWRDYSPGASPGAELSKLHIYVLDRFQNRIVPISFLWKDTDGDGMIGMRDDFEPSNGNCVPVAISADGRIVVFLTKFPEAQNIVDENGDGNPDFVAGQGWLVLIHDRDADGNGVYDEAGIGATRTFVGSMGNNGNPFPAASVSVSANGRIIAFATPDPNNPANPDENWRVIVRDWQNGDQVEIPNAFAPALSDDGTYLAYLQPTAALNEPSPTYLQSKMNLVVQRIERDPDTGRLTLGPSLSLTDLTLPAQSGTADGSAGWGYSDWWGAVTIAVDPRDPNVVYAAFHAWSTDLVDLTLVRSDLVVDGNANTPRLKFYQGVPNIFLARFDFTNIDTNPQAPQLWRLTEWTDQQQADKRRGLPVSLEPPVGQQTQYRLTLAPSLLPAVSFVNGNRLAIVFQSLMGWDKDGDGQVGEDPVDGRDNDGDGKIDEDPPNGLWDIYLANVLLP